ncbi:HPP family protein [Halomicrobium zhouii]|uniref:HPP family protein n=1 Tax=Halomicrobium zhouii TaxID=767519 RepID=A0A1I6K341_9EURY|nr:HPP family protein [Halomicrobium zhouii]SFR85584.1 HPP family protein [Halomicrobium zhouii]
MPDRHTLREWLRQAGRAGALLAGLGGVVWASGLPFVFPSLGPTAYLFATDPDGPESAPRRVVGGHALGVAAGLVAYHLVAGDVTLTAATGPGTLASLRLAVSGVVAVGLTTVGMLATDTGHAPACATTLIVSLGILSSPLEGAIIVLAVVALLVEHELLLRLP